MKRVSLRYASIIPMLALAVACGDDSSSTSDSDSDGSSSSTTATTTDTTTSTTTDSTTEMTTSTTTDATSTTTEGTTDGTTTDATTTDSGSTGGSSGGAVEICGNGVTEGAEACDDGNVYDGDGCSADCSAANCLVPVTHATVQAGVDDLMCATVWIMPGTYTEAVDIQRPVILEGIPIDTVTIDANDGGSTLEITNTTVIARRLTITGGLNNYGGGVFATGSTVTLERSTITGNTATGDDSGGAGIATVNSDLTLLETAVDGNTVSGAAGNKEGGGIRAEGGSVFITGASSVSNNTNSTADTGDTVNLGGGIFALGVELTISGGSTIDGNTIQVAGTTGFHQMYGAGIFSVGDGFLTVTNTAISNNSIDSTSTGGLTDGEGAGLFVGGQDVFLGAGAVVETNDITAADADIAGFGGGLFLVDGIAFLAEATIDGNTTDATATHEAGSQGVGIFAGQLDLQGVLCLDSTLSGNIGTGMGASGFAQGGAAYAETVNANGGLLDFDRCTVSGNQVTGNGSSVGGGVATVAAGTSLLNVFFLNSTLSGNTADATGGALGGGAYADGSAGADANITMLNSTITGNTATEGGGLMVVPNTGSSALSLRNSILYDNIATTGPECSGDLAVTDSLVVGPVLTDCNITGTTILMDPALGNLADNGGPTFTHEIDNMSPAYAVGASNCLNNGNPITVDQRSLPRPNDNTCTLGSYMPQ